MFVNKWKMGITFIFVVPLLITSYAFSWTEVSVKNKSDSDVYAAIYYNQQRATDVVTIAPDKSIEIELPPWKWFKIRYVYVTKYKERLLDDLGKLSSSDFLKLSTSRSEVGVGKGSHRYVIYTDAGLLFSFF